MRKYIILTFLLFPLTIFCQTFQLDKRRWHDFEGKLGENDIQLSIYLLDSGQLNGNYCYKKNENKIKFLGQITDDKIELSESLNERTKGYFKGKILTDSLDWFEGTWWDSAGKRKLHFKLRLSSICSGLPDNRYSDLYGTDEDVERFMKRIKASVLNNDKEWLANHINYPINTTIYRGKKITIKNKKQLIDNFEQIFHREFKSKIKSSCVCNMFNNYLGVMFDKGLLWINNKPNSTKDKFGYNITVINN